MSIEGVQDGYDFSGTGTAYLKMNGERKVNGITTQTAELRKTVPGLGWRKNLYNWRMASEFVEEYRSEYRDSFRNWSIDTFQNEDPFNALPIFVNDTDADRLIGVKQFTGNGDGSETWTGSSAHYLTYLGSETIEVPAGTFECIHVLLQEEWEADWYSSRWDESGTSTGTNSYHYWISPVSGIIKASANETKDADWTEWTAELTSLKISLPDGNTIQKFTVTAGVNNADSVSFSGVLDAVEADFLGVDEIVVTIDAADMPAPQEWTFPINATTFKNRVYSYTNRTVPQSSLKV